MAVAVSPRTCVVGAELSFVVLASGRGACIGVDLASGAFVVVRWPGAERTGAALQRFEVATARVALDADEVHDDPLVRREAVVVGGLPRVVGRLRRRAAERYLRPLLLPEREHLLGFAAPSLPYWRVPNDRPSVCLVAPSGPVSLTRSGAPGLACLFEWRGLRNELPLGDGAGAGSLVPAMDRSGRPVVSGAALADLLGYMPRRVVVALSPPLDGVCHKVVAALLP